MEDSISSVRAVHGALSHLHDVLHVADIHKNGGLKGDPAELEPAWKKLEEALVAADHVMRAPSPEQEQASSWLKTIFEQAAKVEEAVFRHSGNWNAVIWHANDSLHWLVTNGWQSGYEFTAARSRRKLRDLLGRVDSPRADGRTADPTQPYPTPDLYARDKWIYENIQSHTRHSLSLALSKKARIEKWQIISSRNGFKKAANRYAKYHGLPERTFRKAPVND